MATDKLTLHALKQHGKTHPTFKASSAPRPSIKEVVPELPRQTSRTDVVVDNNNGNGGQVKRRPRMTSISDSQISPKSVAPPTRPRMSIFKLVAATKAWHKLATKNSKARDVQKPAVKLENTYRLEPDERKKFLPGKVEKLLSDVMESRLKDVQYNALTCKDLVKDISAHIKARVKAMDFPRYKIVSSLIIMENKGQGTEVASRCIWDSNLDSFATHTYKNSSLVAIAYVHGVYFE